MKRVGPASGRIMMPVIAAVYAMTFGTAQAQGAQAASQLAGVYKPIMSELALLKGLANSGLPVTASPRPPAADTPELRLIDPGRLCQPVGPFRMIAEMDNKLEILPDGSRVVMLFEDMSKGYIRTISLDRGHKPDFQPAFQGDSVGRWENDALVINTVGFDDRIWLTSMPTSYNGELKIREELAPVDGGKYLAYTVTAQEEGANLYTYTRYFQKTSELMDEYPCEIDPSTYQ